MKPPILSKLSILGKVDERLSLIHIYTGLDAVEADGGGGIGRGLGISDLAGDHHAALNGLGQNRLARLRMLIPAELSLIHI